MVLADEVRDIDGRLLLEKGKTIQSNHIKIFKIWGVTSVNIFDNDGDKEETRPDFDPEQYEKIKASTRKLFRFNDLEHPAIKEIFRQSVRFRNEYNCSNECLNSRLPDNDTAKIANQTNGIKRIFESNITLPEVPSIVFELNDVISNPFSSSNDIAQIIKKSPSLTALLLKFAPRIKYATPRNPNTGIYAFNVGDTVAYLLNEDQDIVSLWYIEMRRLKRR